jgi:hypothetical protein
VKQLALGYGVDDLRLFPAELPIEKQGLPALERVVLESISLDPDNMEASHRLVS